MGTTDGTITNGKHSNAPVNKPTMWTNSTGNPVIAMESDHAKTDSLGANLTSVTYGWTIDTLVQTTDVLGTAFLGWAFNTLPNNSKFKI